MNIIFSTNEYKLHSKLCIRALYKFILSNILIRMATISFKSFLLY